MLGPMVPRSQAVKSAAGTRTGLEQFVGRNRSWIRTIPWSDVAMARYRPRLLRGKGGPCGGWIAYQYSPRNSASASRGTPAADPTGNPRGAMRGRRSSTLAMGRSPHRLRPEREGEGQAAALPGRLTISQLRSSLRPPIDPEPVPMPPRGEATSRSVSHGKTLAA
jgi:hypothetical protein